MGEGGALFSIVNSAQASGQQDTWGLQWGSDITGKPHGHPVFFKLFSFKSNCAYYVQSLGEGILYVAPILHLKVLLSLGLRPAPDM